MWSSQRLSVQDSGVREMQRGREDETVGEGVREKYEEGQHDRQGQGSSPREKSAVDSSALQHCLGETWRHCEKPRLALSRLQRESSPFPYSPPTPENTHCQAAANRQEHPLDP
ncbi:hypothetical protein NQZ68_012045 [Dissostichus eleginoides]|nr:hypothetical protein NQZ68_012045 [Dissostichus eleginoides]